MRLLKYAEKKHPKLKFELLDNTEPEHNISRAKVIGGWLISEKHFRGGVTFYPDPNHEWDGNSLD